MSSDGFFNTFNPIKNDFNDQCHISDRIDQIEEKLIEVKKAAPLLLKIDDKELSIFLKKIKSELLIGKNDIHHWYCAESGLDDNRFQAEFKRTIEQIDHFSDYILSRDWKNKSKTTVVKGGQSFTKIKRPIGPILVLGASNFPLAYSTIGGDSVAAIAAKCPVILKAHPYHVGTSLEVMKAIERAIEQTSVPKGAFTHFIDDGYQLTEYLAKHAMIKGIGFTGSLSGGQAIMGYVQNRNMPIPVFAEMGSLNPIIITKELKNVDKTIIANKISFSVCNDRGQFCTKPGLIFIPKTDYGRDLCSLIKKQITSYKTGPMLHPKMKDDFDSNILNLKNSFLEVHESLMEKPFHVANTIAILDQNDFKTNFLIESEIFGPFTTIVMYDDTGFIEKYLTDCKGQLACSIFSDDANIKANKNIIDLAISKVGRLIINDVPTGVVVSQAMQHGGPYPSSSDSRFTAVGSSSIFRFVRDVTIQGNLIE